MKALKFIIIGILLFFATSGQAQISVNVNLGAPPMWGPAGYTDVQYYYLPDVEAYYDVPSSQFIYFSGGTWVHRAYLPSRYRNYDLYNGYKVVMTDYRGNAPYAHFKEHKVKYAKGYKGHAQKSIGQKPQKGSSGPKVYTKSRNSQNKSRIVSKSSGHSGEKKGGKGKKK
ncbi:MAG: hypothetical protein K0M40_12930 [Prolixibacteraceae bacterium]|nr:hypothetical protein [Prolixibacteraceae bacterium]